MADDRFPPPGTGESTTERGEDVAKENAERGRVEHGVDARGRTDGGSTARMSTGIDPKEPVDPESPNLPTS